MDSLLWSTVQQSKDLALSEVHMDKAADFSCATQDGLNNQSFAVLLLGLFEVSMEITSQVMDSTGLAAAVLCAVFDKYDSLMGILRAGISSSQGSGKRGNKVGSSTSTKKAKSGKAGEGGVYLHHLFFRVPASCALRKAVC